MYPLLSLKQITLDAEFSQKLPRHLAYYQLALPIAQDEDYITVAMAHPDNETVVSVIAAVLGSEVMPVRSDPKDIKTALDQVWSGDVDVTTTAGVLAWNATGIAQIVADALTLPLAITESMQDLTAKDAALIVMQDQDLTLLGEILSHSNASILWSSGDSARIPKRILQILRGHTPDRKVLDYVAPMAYHCKAEVTLLAAATPSIVDYRHGNPLMSDFANLLASNNPRSGEIAEYGQFLTNMNISGRRKIRQGTLEDVIISEIREGSYDLVAIAAEAYGDFVYRILKRIPDVQSHFLIIKP